MIIRPYNPNDTPILIRLYNDSVRSTIPDTLTREQELIMYFRNVLDIHNSLAPPNISMVLEDECEVRGFGMMKPDGYINFLFIHPDHFQKGYGKALIRNLEFIAKGSMIERLYLHTTDYATKHHIYEKLGYHNLGPEDFDICGVKFTGNKMIKLLY